MGWGSGTDLFDEVVEIILLDVPFDKRESAIERVITAFENKDWDCQSDSIFWDNPTVQRVMKRLHPDWFSDESLS